jgi:hypothetical protein
LCLIGGAALIGVVLYGLWRRGHRRDDHPVCRACEFDLFGWREPASCPECGADLNDADTVRRGNRQRYPALKWNGAALASPAVVLILVGMYSGLGAGWLNPYKPTGLLQWEASVSSVLADSALDKLLCRQKGGDLPGAELLQLLKQALAVQSDPSQRWIGEWGDVVVAAKRAGVGQPKHYNQYAKQSATLKLETRQRVHGDTALPLRHYITATQGRAQGTELVCFLR